MMDNAQKSTLKNRKTNEKQISNNTKIDFWDKIFCFIYVHFSN